MSDPSDGRRGGGNERSESSGDDAWEDAEPKNGLIRAAGAAVWRSTGTTGAGTTGAGTTGSELEVVLVHRPRYDDWSLPKGKIDHGEHSVDAAVREVREETGLEIRLGRRLPTACYEVEGLPKRVAYWAAEAPSGPGEGGAAFEPNTEVDRIVWLPPARARELLSYPWDRRVLDALAGAAARTEPIIVVRHARAEPRSAWPLPDDAGRPLNAKGMAQADALAGLLARFGTPPVITSDTTRCAQTILPYARAHGADLRVDHALSEHGFDEDPTRALRLADELGAAGTGIIVCSHGPVLPSFLGRALAAAGGLEAPTPPKHRLERAECVLVHVAAGQVVAVDRMKPPSPEG